jgi:hypothetical protein
MVTNAAESRRKSSVPSEPTSIFLCNCPVDRCTQNYSPEMGYFATERVQDHWFVTGSSSLKLHRNETQVLCADQSRNVMFLEKIDPQTSANQGTNLSLPPERLWQDHENPGE